MAANKVRLEVCGSSYVVSTSDTEEYLLGLAERLDKDMRQLMVDSPNASVTAAAVITALSYLDEAEKSAFGADNMRGQIQGYLEDASRAKVEAEEAKREAQRLRNELRHYEEAAKRTAKPKESLLDYGQNEKVVAPAAAAPPAEPAKTGLPDDHVEGQLDLDGYERP